VVVVAYVAAMGEAGADRAGGSAAAFLVALVTLLPMRARRVRGERGT